MKTFGKKSVESKPISLEFHELGSLFFLVPRNLPASYHQWSPRLYHQLALWHLGMGFFQWELQWRLSIAICWQQFWGSLHPGITWDSGRPSEWICGYETQLASHLRMIFKSLSMPSSWNSEQMGIKDQGFVTVSVVPSLPTTNHQRPCLVLPFAAEVHAFWRHYSQRNSRPSGDNCWAEMTFSTGKMAVELFNNKQRIVDRFSCSIRMHWMQTLKDEGCLL